MGKFLIALIIIISVLGCNPSSDHYEQSIQEWHQLRIDSLKGETGFLNLAGLFWLNDGINTFGSDSLNDLDFTNVSPTHLGSFQLIDSLVYLIPQGKIVIEGKEVVDTTLVFENNFSKTMKFKSLNWFVIKRGVDIGVRLRDFTHPLLQEFDSIDYFKTDYDWNIEAEWRLYEDTLSVPFSNVLGMSINYPVYGAFYFEIDGKEFKLEPLGEAGPDGYFVMFYDKTSGHSTYGSGRYLYVDVPNEDGIVRLDFNKAYNPPCAFTEFATCLFPHKENRLPIFVNAGEKFSGH